jgi:hypothetical protein
MRTYLFTGGLPAFHIRCESCIILFCKDDRWYGWWLLNLRLKVGACKRIDVMGEGSMATD